MYTDKDGMDIMEWMGIEAGPGTWAFDDCAVVESGYNSFTVYMEADNGCIVCQHIHVLSMDAMRMELDAGCSPTSGMEDAYGHRICPDNAELADGQGKFAFETNNGNCGSTDYFDDVSEAVTEAQYSWEKLSKHDRRTYLTAGGAVYSVTDRGGNCIYDCIENARRAADREEDADRLEDEPSILSDCILTFVARHGQAEADSVYGLADGGWDGTESPMDLMADYRISCDLANDMLDLLAVLRAQREREADADE